MRPPLPRINSSRSSLQNVNTAPGPTVDIELGQAVSPATTGPPALSSRGSRAQSLSIPSFFRSASTRGNTGASGLPPPVTAPVPLTTSQGSQTNTRRTGRERAHTVSVVLRPRSATAGSNDYASGPLGRIHTRSTIPSRRSTEERPDSPTISARMAGKDDDLDDEVVGVLDCVDDHVSTVNHLQNVSNSLIFPHIPQLWSRRPEVVIPQAPSDDSLAPLNLPTEEPTLPSLQSPSLATPVTTTRTQRSSSGTRRGRSSTVSRLFPAAQQPTSPGYSPETPAALSTAAPTTGFETIHESPPVSPEPLPQDEAPQSLDDDVAQIEEDHDLDAHVRRLLKRQKRKDKAKQILRGLWTYVKTPMGFITAVYFFCVVFWGAAIVLFLLGWIPTNSKNTQDIWVEISSQVVNGLFTVTGVGLIPWRVMDTYRMAIIWNLRRKITKRRLARGFDSIEDPNDIPDPKEVADYVSVLTDKEQQQLAYQQDKFAISQTWYRPHATETHKAFPITLALWNTILMDGNSLFQCILCGCMWGMNRHKRPAWTTGTLIPCSFLCGIAAAIIIWQGSVRTKKTLSVESKLREALGVPLAIGGWRDETQDGASVTTGKTGDANPSSLTFDGENTLDLKTRAEVGEVGQEQHELEDSSIVRSSAKNKESVPDWERVNSRGSTKPLISTTTIGGQVVGRGAEKTEPSADSVTGRDGRMGDLNALRLGKVVE